MLHTNTFGAGVVVVAADVFFLLTLVAFKYIQMTLKIFNPENSIGVLILNIYHRLHEAKCGTTTAHRIRLFFPLQRGPHLQSVYTNVRCKMSKLGNKFQSKLEKLYKTKKIYVYNICLNENGQKMRERKRKRFCQICVL